MLLWREMFDAEDFRTPDGEDDPRTRAGVRKSSKDGGSSPPWFSWPAPPGGFIDLGYVRTVGKRVLYMLTY